MSEQSNNWDRQWNRLLTQCHGGEVESNPDFKAKLLGKLRQKTALNRQTDAAGESEDKNWSRLLAAAYGPSEADSMFQNRLLTQLKARQRDLTAARLAEGGDDAIKTILTKSYTPVAARKEFQTRLLYNLKERQRVTNVTRRSTRRRTIFLSALSSLSAAALVMFAVWVFPMGRGETSPVTRPGSEMALAAMENAPPAAVPAPVASSNRGAVFANFSPSSQSNSDFPSKGVVIPAVTAAGLALASAGSYRVADAFSGPALPETVRGIGMEFDDGKGWRPMDTTRIARIEPGMAFRPQSGTPGATGLGFGDGSTMLLTPDTVVEATADGFAVRRGTLAVTVPENSKDRFRLHFAERDIAIERGTMLAVSMESPEKYAEGGAPAPLVRVADGGMALARGKNGSGPLLANQLYRIDKYVTPDLPGRPLCATECEELEKSLRFQAPAAPSAGMPGAGVPPNLLVSAERPSYRSAPQPAGFVKKDTRWIASGYTNQPLVRIQYLSDDYFGFANERRDLAPALALGAEVILDGGDGRFYEIHK